ncbi:MauE/DoxX family redox-associated membrane protein [Intrasporangium sp. YIM S08009]|uniref:MauE/DoxX family redox-associated membrane protein n=1 Tax=Intrasporangium zincisolvens TaxID=3080018 RepID=UPI002B0520EF|nr:MauE/DoxX family redox-associated membrane protein [Intrasporangium sp. YIM S08009]
MPTDALAIAPVILAAVLVVSAVGKLRSPSRSAEAFRDLRVPAPLRHRAVVEALPWAELLLAVLLVTAGGALLVVAAVAAVLLFAAYLALVVRALGFEAPVDCACFGEFAPGRITRRTVVRNAWLLALAVLNLVALTLVVPGPADGASVLARLATDGAWAWLVAAGAAALTTWLVTAPSPDAGDAPSAPAPASGPLTDDEGDYLRSRTPSLPVLLADGTETDLRQLSTRRAQLLLFVSEGCGSCQDVIAAAPHWRTELPAVDVRVVVTAAPGEGALTSTEEPQSLHDPRQRLRDTFGFWGTPSALLLGADGLLAGGPVTGSEAVPEFVDEIRDQLGALA